MRGDPAANRIVENVTVLLVLLSDTRRARRGAWTDTEASMSRDIQSVKGRGSKALLQDIR